MEKVIPWDELVDAYCLWMSIRHGRPAKSPRLVIRALILKHKQKWTDEETVLQIQENPYLQYFCGYSNFSLSQPFAPSLFVEIRKRMGEEVFDRFEEVIQARLESIQSGKQNRDRNSEEGDGFGVTPEAVAESAESDEAPEAKPGSDDVALDEPELESESDPEPQGKLIIDATVAEQAIRYPTDLSTLNEAREISERLIDRLYPGSGLPKKPRTYRRKTRQNFLAVAKKYKPRKNRLRSGIRRQLQYLRRNLGHIDTLLARYAPPVEAVLGGLMPPPSKPFPTSLSYQHVRQLWVIRTVHDQQKEMYDKRLKRCDDRIVSISQPHVRPIIRGKSAKSVEFGSKLSVSLGANGLAHVDTIRWDAFNESGNLVAQVEAFKKRYGRYPAVVLADGIYGTRDNRRYCKDRGIRFGGKPLGRPKKVTAANKEEVRKEKRQRRQDHLKRIPIEGKFGQGKNGYGLGRIRAKLINTSEAWIQAIFLVMNLMVVLRFFFASKMVSIIRVIAVIQTHVDASVQYDRLPVTSGRVASPALRCRLVGAVTF
ncbi:MAG: IS5 family transposase [Magnetococcales bacterium]|nr:IS5 family transposase [Magnetococcales bacterium]